jgi:hypothetical protein
VSLCVFQKRHRTAKKTAASAAMKLQIKSADLLKRSEAALIRLKVILMK